MVESENHSSAGGAGAAAASLRRPSAKNKHFVKVIVIGDSIVGKISLIQIF